MSVTRKYFFTDQEDMQGVYKLDEDKMFRNIEF